METSMDVKNPIDFCSDERNNALIKLRDDYEGKCYQGKFIIKVLSVDAVSSCRIHNTGEIGTGCVDVQFTVLWSRRGEGSTVPMVKIVAVGEILTGESCMHNREEKNGGSVDLRGKESMLVSFLEPSAALREGVKIPAKIVNVRYEPKSIPSATAKMLTCREKCTVWEISTGPTSASNGVEDKLTGIYKSYMEDYDRVMKGISDSESISKFFKYLLSTYQEADVALPGGFEEHEGFEGLLSKMHKGTYWCRPLQKPFGTSQVYRLDGAAALKYAESGDADVKRVDCKVAFMRMLLEATSEVETLAELVYQFRTIEDIKMQKGVWKVMSNSQRTAK